MIAKTFTAITAQIHNDKLVLLVASDGRMLYNGRGISSIQALDFLFSLKDQAKAKEGNVFICYGFSRDNEFIFRDLPRDLKDKLFQSYGIRKTRRELTDELDDLESIFYTADKDSQEFEQADFFRHVNKTTLKSLNDIEFEGYKLRLANGKRLVIRRDGKQILIYDIFGFFNQPLRESVKTWLDKDVPFLNRHSLILKSGLIRHQLKAFAEFEVKYIEKLGTQLYKILIENGINLRSYHGATSLSSWVLSKGKARKQYCNYRYRRQLAPELRHAAMQAFFAGRAEQFKIGTVADVRVYDINSAYALGASMLPIMLRKPRYARAWKPEPFSFWRCEYDFTSITPYFGLLPNREFQGRVSYKLRGSGTFWQPEISYLLKHYPQCLEVKDGYFVPYERAPFTDHIIELYGMRRQLQALGSPLEKIIKLALAAIYGKFCQSFGKSEYYNIFYAGFITSLTRSQLLDATRGREHETVCFLTDAIHTTGDLDVKLSNELGEYRRNEYMLGTYLDNGVYKVVDYEGKIKQKSCGYRVFDFDAALAEFQTTHKFKAIVEYFTGHNLHTLMPIRYKDYLHLFNETQENEPLTSGMRSFKRNDGSIDLTKSYIDSAAYNLYNGQESREYLATGYRDKRAGLDSVIAGRVI